MTTIFPHIGAATTARTVPYYRAAGRLVDFARYVMACLAVARERQVLARLDRHQLADAGINPAAASREAARSFWDIPGDRRWRR